MINVSRFCFLTLLYLLASPTHAVIGGFKTDVPDDVVMVLNDRGGICTASVISSRVILTSAHCVIKTSKIVVHYKTADNTPYTIDVIDFVTHPKYYPDAFAKRKVTVDMALLKVAEPLPMRHPGTLSLQRPEKGEEVLLMGFGQTDETVPPSGDFNSLDLKVVEPYGQGKILIWLTGTGNQGACQGDSGGPIYFQGKNVAVISGASGHQKADCGHYTQGLLVVSQKDWITSTMARWGEFALWE